MTSWEAKDLSPFPPFRGEREPGLEAGFRYIVSIVRKASTSCPTRESPGGKLRAAGFVTGDVQ